MTEAKCLCGHDKDSHGGGVGWCLYHKGRDECVALNLCRSVRW